MAMLAGVEQPSEDLSLERAAFDVHREGFDLFRAACLLPRVEGREVDVQAGVEVVERWAANVRVEPGHPDDPRVRLIHHLFVDQGLRGDADNAHDPDGCFVDVVLARRRGHGLPLALITLAVADAAGVPAFPVMLPHHALVGLGAHEAFVLIDPSAGGRLLKLEDVYALGGVSSVEDLAEAIAASSPDRLLMRLLAVLHGCYLRSGERDPLVRVLSRMLLFDERNPGLWLQRAQLRLEEADFPGARADLSRARTLPLDEDWLRVAEDVERRLQALGTMMQ